MTSSFLVLAVCGTSEPAVISSFSAEVTAPSPCPLRNVTNTPESSGESHGRVTVTLGLVSPAAYWRQSKALKSAQREAKRKLVAQLEISHEAAEAILRSQAARTDEILPGIKYVSHQLALLRGHENVFFCTECGAVNAGGSLRLLKSLCDGSGESHQKARRKFERGLMPTEHVVEDAKRAY